MTKALIQKYIKDTCTDQERKLVQDWLSDPRNEDEVTAILKVSWDNASNIIPNGIRSKADFIQNVIRISNEQGQFSATSLQEEPLSKTRILILSAVKVAASIVLIIGLSLMTYQFTQQSEGYAEVELMEKYNPAGRKSTIILPDGSKVKLNAESKLRYARNFDNHKREVILEGEAFFEVEKDSSRPFVVRTGEISTTVLGTSFNIRAYAKSHKIDIAVVTGKVEVKKAAFQDNDEAYKAYLTPHEMASYDRKERVLDVGKFNMEEAIGWKDGILIFKNANPEQIAIKLKSWYGVQVEIDENQEIASKRYTGKFDNNSLEYVLKAISYTSDISFEMHENKVTLKQKKYEK